jgi:ApaG protein
MSEATTRGIRVKVESEFVPDRSDPHNGEFFFAYHVKIENHGEEPVRLLSRHWIITDGMGKEQEVRGPGVVGKQPRLRPGEAFEYTSACPLSTQIGSMYGSYQMVTDGGETFDAKIAPFTLAIPGALN